MANKYKHLTEQDRIFIRVMLGKRFSKSKIAEILKVDPSTIHREIKRNSIKFWQNGLKTYDSMFAHKKYLQRRKRGLKLEKDESLRNFVHSKLKSGWSPYQIEGRLKKENGGQCMISHETIYSYVYSNYSRRNLFYKYLRRKHDWRIKQGQRKPRLPKELLITARPNHINNREEFGHWECDLMMFKKGIKTNLITLRERKSRYLIAIKNENKEASGTALALISTITKIKEHVKSITFDQGSEFKKYDWVKNCLEADIYFCEPASPFQKGGIENGNGMLRIDLPRDCNANELKQRTLIIITNRINNRPLKCLNYETPKESFLKLMRNTNENKPY